MVRGIDDAELPARVVDQREKVDRVVERDRRALGQSEPEAAFDLGHLGAIGLVVRRPGDRLDTRRGGNGDRLGVMDAPVESDPAVGAQDDTCLRAETRSAGVHLRDDAPGVGQLKRSDPVRARG